MQDRKLLRAVEGAIQGDQEAFRSLILMKRRGILGIAINLMRDKRDGEDIAQEVILQIHRQISTLRDPRAFNLWMYRLVYNTCMNAKKKMKRSQNDTELDEKILGVEEERDELIPEEFLVNEDSRREMLKILNQLPDRYRMCLFLYYYEEQSYQEIASVLDIEIQDVANALNRGKKKLRELIEEQSAAHATEGEKKRKFIPIIFLFQQLFDDDFEMNVPPIMLKRFDEMVTGLCSGGISASASLAGGTVAAEFASNTKAGDKKRRKSDLGLFSLIVILCVLAVVGAIPSSSDTVGSFANGTASTGDLGIISSSEEGPNRGENNTSGQRESVESFVEGEGISPSDGEASVRDANRNRTNRSTATPGGQSSTRNVPPTDTSKPSGDTDNPSDTPLPGNDELTDPRLGDEPKDGNGQTFPDPNPPTRPVPEPEIPPVTEATVHYANRFVTLYYQYTVYTAAGESDATRLVIIERKDSNGVVSQVQNTLPVSEALPSGFGVVDAFEAWNSL